MKKAFNLLSSLDKVLVLLSTLGKALIIIYVFGPGPAGPGAVLIPHSKLTD